MPDAAAINALTSDQTDVFNVQVSDGSLSASTTLTINITGANDAPVISNLGPAASSTEQVFAALDTNVALSDVELDAANGGAGNYAGASVTIERQGGADAQDTYSFAANPSFTVSGNELQAGGQTFATFTSTGGTLTITFTSSDTIATAALADAVVQSITYANSSDTPPAAVTLDYTFSDGLTSDTESLTVNITDVADTPIIPPVYNGTGDPNDHDTDSAGSASSTPLINFHDASGAHTIQGSNTADSIFAGNGNDTVYGHDGNDTINGEGAADISLYGQAGDDTISGGEGADQIFGGSGNDTIYGMQNPETFSPDDGADTIYGGSGNDTIFGQSGDDEITGGYGADTITGGLGADDFNYVSVLDTGDTITDFTSFSMTADAAQRDQFDFSAFPGTLSVAGHTTTVQANSINWYQDGANTIVLADVNGDAVADVAVTLQNFTATNLSTNDFIV